MKQIAKIAHQLKRNFAGYYNDYYKSAEIYYDKEDEELYLKCWGNLPKQK